VLHPVLENQVEELGTRITRVVDNSSIDINVKNSIEPLISFENNIL
jgi:hypothetical protein